MGTLAEVLSCLDGGDLGFDLSVKIHVCLGDRIGVLGRRCLLLCNPRVQRVVDGYRLTKRNQRLAELIPLDLLHLGTEPREAASVLLGQVEQILGQLDTDVIQKRSEVCFDLEFGKPLPDRGFGRRGRRGRRFQCNAAPDRRAQSVGLVHGGLRRDRRPFRLRLGSMPLGRLILFFSVPGPVGQGALPVHQALRQSFLFVRCTLRFHVRSELSRGFGLGLLCLLYNRLVCHGLLGGDLGSGVFLCSLGLSVRGFPLPLLIQGVRPVENQV